MRFFSPFTSHVSVTLIIFMILSISVAAPRAHNHNHRHQGYGNDLPSAPAGSGSGLLFNPVDSNMTNHDLYLVPIQARQLAYAHASASATASLTTNTAALSPSVGLMSDYGNASVFNFTKLASQSALESSYIVQPHQRVHQTVQATSSSGLPSIGYSAITNTPAPSRSSSKATSRKRKTSSSTGIRQSSANKAASSVSDPAAWNTALTFTMHMPNFNNAWNQQPTGFRSSSSLSAPSTKLSAQASRQTTQISSSVVSSSLDLASSQAGTTQPSVDYQLGRGYGDYHLTQQLGVNSQASTTQPSVDYQLGGGYGDYHSTQQLGLQSDYPSLYTSRTSPGLSLSTDISVQPTTLSSISGYPAMLSSTTTSTSSDQSVSLFPSSTASATPVSSAASSPLPARYASGSSVITPRVLSGKLHGPSSNEPTSQYIDLQPPQGLTLPGSLLAVGVNTALSTSYSLATDTGIPPIDATTEPLIKDLKSRPHLSRDGGKGGYLNGQKLFLFCDTGSYTSPTPDRMGDFLGFVSSSIATDKGFKGAYGQPLVLEDGIGEWSDDVGRMRGLAPLTTGEQSYNLVMQGKGQRYAIWPESSIIPLNRTHALLYAPIIYDNVDWSTRRAVFTYAGSTLLSLTAETSAGPRADRIVDKIFQQEEVEWGTIGGFRSYGPSGVGGNDGRVYVFGKLEHGLLIGRVDASYTAEREYYEYWDGATWSRNMPDHSSTAYFLPGAYMDGDLVYSPAHLTFIFIYLNPYADNTFYFRYLMADRAILPPSVPGGNTFGDFAENLVKYKWSEEQVLYRADSGPTGRFIYAGGVHQGYFDGDDITNGGKRMLISWTAPTGDNPAAMATEYLHMTAHVEFV